MTIRAFPLVALGLTVLVLGCGKEEQVAKAAAPPSHGEILIEPGSPTEAYLAVDTVRSRHERVVATLPAQVVVSENHAVRIASPVVGRVRVVHVQLGDRVKAGAPLVQIVSADVGQAESDLLKAESALQQAEAALERAKALYAGKVIAQKDFQQATNDEQQARAERDRAAARVRLLGASQKGVDQEYTLRAPIDGEVVERNVSPGAEVRNDNGQTLVTVADLDTLWLTASLYQRDLALAHRGDRLIFTSDANPGRTFTGSISYVSDVLDPDTRTALLRAVMPNPRHDLRPLIFGQAKLVAPVAGAALVVPVGALVTRGSDTFVFTEKAPGHYEPRRVTVSDDDGESAVISSGLARGERVVVKGALLLSAEADKRR